MKVIINADDCGYSQQVNADIEKFIKLGKITSTTIMANMPDLAGSKRMYDLYGNTISFGVHLNLDCGSPLLYSQQLLDYGFYRQESDGSIVFDGRKFYNKMLPPSLWNPLSDELLAQINAIRDCGIQPSHVDGHHHVHASIALIPILPHVLRESGIYKVRRIWNYMPVSLNYLCRQGWAEYVKLATGGKSLMLDRFSSFRNYYNKRAIKCNSIELMCHPGKGPDTEENSLMLSVDYDNLTDFELINYNNITK